ncbi:ribosomal protein S12 methylthiotransferase accessory factor [Haloactinopolyspora alba]|uniref:Ribosomal protein S12 methylthiotransferase accessory factor n=1 Tax=Haloactinopolyspora alba TaxID=648780 RepID=A0A2P8DWP7_9ACTN|nr:TOMM precursor leader peptide-binding protein [Haloactinopolyspora alba]PSL01624.1 ribosomal protein S12 methylthiotransferase accessory factor [Haloactinopolyspora alba]
MTTLQDDRDAHRPATDAAGDTATSTAAFGRQVADLLPAELAARCPAIDVAVLGVPGHEHRVTVPVDRSPSTATVSLRRYGSAVIVAATPGGGGPCPRCLDRRWTVCRPMIERRIVDEPHGVLPGEPGAVPPHVVAVAAVLVEAAATPPAGEPGHPVWEIDTRTASVRRYGLLRDSSCDACAAPVADTSSGAEIHLRSVPALRPGATRSGRPEDLGLPMDALANPVCGMLGGPGIRAYHATATAPVSGHFEVRSKYGLHEMWWSGHAESYQRSELLGALEGLERDAGQRPRRVEVARRAAVTELDAPYVEMEQCGLYTQDFYDRHAEKYVPWSENPSVPWVWGWSLRDGRALLVPEQIAYYLDHREDHRNTVQECSNGCASGSSVTEAVLHGLLELVERDAFLISWYDGLTRAEIDLDTVDHPLVQQMRAHVDLLGYDLRCFDIRVDLPVPAVGAVAVRRDGGPGTLCFAGGASLDPDDAVRAAVCEVASYVTGFPERVGESIEHNELMVTDYGHVTELAHHALLFGMPEMARHAEHWLRQDHRSPIADVFADWTTSRAPVTDLREPVDEIVALLAERGHDTVVVDQTTPEQQALGLSTVATIVPGLIPIDFGWHRQRVLRMPRTLWAPYRGGHVPRPLDPGDLHLVPHPFP